MLTMFSTTQPYFMYLHFKKEDLCVCVFVKKMVAFSLSTLKKHSFAKALLSKSVRER